MEAFDNRDKQFSALITNGKTSHWRFINLTIRLLGIYFITWYHIKCGIMSVLRGIIINCITLYYYCVACIMLYSVQAVTAGLSLSTGKPHLRVCPDTSAYWHRNIRMRLPGYLCL